MTIENIKKELDSSSSASIPEKAAIIYLETNKEDLDKLLYLGFNCSFLFKNDRYFVKAEKENLSLPLFGTVTEEQFFKVFKNSKKTESLPDECLEKSKNCFKPYGFAGNMTYVEKVKEIIKCLQ